MAEAPGFVTLTKLQAFVIEALAAMKMPRYASDGARICGAWTRTVSAGELWPAGDIAMDAEPTVERDAAAITLLDGQKGLSAARRRSLSGQLREIARPR